MTRYDQEQIDQIYARLTAGPIPDGPFDGGLFFPKGQRRTLSEIVGFAGLAVELKSVKLELLGSALWKGKVFYRDDWLLRNRIETPCCSSPLSKATCLRFRRSPRTDETSGSCFLPALLRPACSTPGASPSSSILLHGRAAGVPPAPRLSGRQERFAGARRNPHGAARVLSRRAYIGKVFLLNFTLYNAEVAERDGAAFTQTRRKEDCCGTQSRKVQTASN
jgi:hypothetical protein